LHGNILEFFRAAYFLDAQFIKPLAFPPIAAPLERTADMKRVIIILLLLAALAGAVLVYYMMASRPAPKGASLLPEATLVFVDVPDFSQARADFTRTELYALWHEPEVQAFLEKPLAAVQGLFAGPGTAKEQTDLAAEILDTLQGEVFLAVTRISIIPVFNPGVVLGVDARHKRIQATALLYVLENDLKRSHPNGRFQEKKHLGVKYRVWELQPGLQICHAWLNSLAVFTLDEDTLRDVIAAYTGQSPRDFRPLAASARYRNVLRQAPQDNQFLAYLNVEELLNLVGPLLALAPQTAAMYENLARIQTSAAGMTFLDGGIEDVGFLAYSTPNPRPTPPTQRKTLAFTTPETLVYVVGSADAAAAYDGAMQLLSQSGNANVMSTMTQFQEALRKLGVHPREDLLQKLGPEFAVISRWPAGAPAPHCALVTEIVDTAPVRSALDNTLDALKHAALGDDTQFPWDESEFAGQKVRTVHLGGLLAPTCVATDRFLILASSPDCARELLSQAKNAGPTLARSELYVQSMKRLPANGSSYAYADLRGLFEPLYGLGRSSLSQLAKNDFVDLTKLPAPQTVAKHLFPFVSATVSEPEQEMTIAFSPFGRPLLLAAGVGGAIAAVVPTLSQYATPVWPRTFSGMAAPVAPPGNQTATSQTPAPQ
jgi:hypothetical protein